MIEWKKVSLRTTNSQNTTIAMSSDSNSPETTTISEQNTTTNETGTGKQGRKKTKSSVLSDEQKKVCIQSS